MASKLEAEILELAKEKEFLEKALVKEKRDIISKRLKSKKIGLNERFDFFKNGSPVKAKNMKGNKLPPISNAKSMY